MSSEEICVTCKNTQLWHEENRPMHPFNNGSMGARTALPTRQDRKRANIAQRGSEGPQIASMPSDPVLRIALINRGILTPADLEAAQHQLLQALVEVSHEGKVQVRTPTSMDVGERSVGSPQMGTQSEHDKD